MDHIPRLHHSANRFTRKRNSPSGWITPKNPAPSVSGLARPNPLSVSAGDKRDKTERSLLHSALGSKRQNKKAKKRPLTEQDTPATKISASSCRRLPVSSSIPPTRLVGQRQTVREPVQIWNLAATAAEPRPRQNCFGSGIIWLRSLFLCAAAVLGNAVLRERVCESLPFPPPEPGCEWAIKCRRFRLMPCPGLGVLFFFPFSPKWSFILYPFHFVTNDKNRPVSITDASINRTTTRLSSTRKKPVFGVQWRRFSSLVHLTLSISISCCFLLHFPLVCLLPASSCVSPLRLFLYFFPFCPSYCSLYSWLNFIIIVAIRVDFHRMPVAGIAN